MSCPICGANCKCKNRGAGGICCSCHRHKVRRILVLRSSISSTDPAKLASFDQHLKWQKSTEEKEAHQRQLDLSGGAQ